MERGLTKQDINHMTIGQVVDFIQAFNKRQKDAEKDAEHQKKVKHYRLATPQEVSEFNRK